MSTYPHEKTLLEYEKGRMDTKMATGQSLRHIGKLYEAQAAANISRYDLRDKVDTMGSRLNSLETRSNALERKANKLEARTEMLETRVDALQSQVEHLTTLIETFLPKHKRKLSNPKT